MGGIRSGHRRPKVRLPHNPDRADRVKEAANILRDFLFERVYYVSGASPEAAKARTAVEAMYIFYVEHPEDIPREYRLRENSAERWALDYIAGMTDRYGLRKVQELGLLPEARAEAIR